MDVKGDVSVSVTLSDGTPIVETLEQIMLKVSETLDAFKPEFK